jgi:hypothetical protein
MFIMESLPPNNSPGPMPGELAQRLIWSRSNLTLSQWQIWHEQRSGASNRPLYSLGPLATAFTFHGGLDPRLFRQAFQSVVERSDALRSVFVEQDGVPQRYVVARLALAMDIVDLSAVYQPVAAYEQWMAERDLRPLAPAVRTFDSTLLRLGDQHYVWRLALHRLIADSCSLALIYRHTAEAYAATAAGSIGTLRQLPSFEEYARYERAHSGATPPAVEGVAASRPHARSRKPLPVPGERYALDFGLERTAALRSMAADFAQTGPNGAAGGVDVGDGRAAILLFSAAALAALLARLRKCRTVCIDTEVDLRQLGPWQDTIGRISRACTLTVEDVQMQSLPGLAGRLGRELSNVRLGVQAEPKGERPAPACRALLQLDDMVFGPLAGVDAKVERLDSCCSQRKQGELRESKTGEAKTEPCICLRIEGYGGRDNLKAVFTFCGAQIAQERGPQLAQEYMRLLDALLSAREQPIQALHWGH